MLIATLGSAGIGLVWGWLVALAGARGYRPALTAAVLSAASLLPAAEVLLLAGWLAALIFLGSAALALMVHLGWLGELRQRFGAPPKL